MVVGNRIRGIIHGQRYRRKSGRYWLPYEVISQFSGEEALYYGQMAWSNPPCCCGRRGGVGFYLVPRSVIHKWLKQK